MLRRCDCCDAPVADSAEWWSDAITGTRSMLSLCTACDESDADPIPVEDE